VIDALLRVMQPDSYVRQQAEQDLRAMEAAPGKKAHLRHCLGLTQATKLIEGTCRYTPTAWPAYPAALCRILLEPSVPLPTRQLAAMVLKVYVQQHWTMLDGEQIGFILANEVRRVRPMACAALPPLLLIGSGRCIHYRGGEHVLA